MRISDWSSDVCSSDLLLGLAAQMAGQVIADDAGLAHLLDLLDLLAIGVALEHRMIEVAGEPRVLQAQGVEMAFDLREALLHDLAQHHSQAVAQVACQPELQEHRQLEQADAVDQQGRSEEHTSEL